MVVSSQVLVIVVEVFLEGLVRLPRIVWFDDLKWRVIDRLDCFSKTKWLMIWLSLIIYFVPVLMGDIIFIIISYVLTIVLSFIH